MLRKILGILTLCILSFIFGCAQKHERAVYFAVGGTPHELDFWNQVISEFEAESGIKVITLRQTTDTDQRRQGLLISLKARKDNPDVFLMDVAWVAQFAASGWLEPLAGLREEDAINLNAFFSKVLQTADQYHGKLLALPVYIDGGLLYYRKDLLEKFGFERPPQTWDELVDVSVNIQNEIRKENPNFYGFVWQGAQYEGLICNFLEFAASNNGGILIQDDNVRLDFQENQQAVELMRNLIHEYQISPPNTFTEMKEETVRRYFQNGNALFERNWPYAWSLHQAEESKIKGKVGIAPLPHFESGQSVATLGGWHIGISKFSDVKPEAWKLVQFIVSYSTQKRLAINLGWNPGRKDVYHDPEVLKKLPHFADLKEVFENAIARPTVPYYSQISEVLQQSLNGILAREVTTQQGLAKAEDDARKIVKRYQVLR